MSPGVGGPSAPAAKRSWRGRTILASVILVVVARIVLVAGRIEHGLVLIYISIAISLVAVSLLCAVVLRARRRHG
jgi:hypothetical protein